MLVTSLDINFEMLLSTFELSNASVDGIEEILILDLPVKLNPVDLFVKALTVELNGVENDKILLDLVRFKYVVFDIFDTLLITLDNIGVLERYKDGVIAMLFEIVVSVKFKDVILVEVIDIFITTLESVTLLEKIICVVADKFEVVVSGMTDSLIFRFTSETFSKLDIEDNTIPVVYGTVGVG